MRLRNFDKKLVKHTKIKINIYLQRLSLTKITN